MTRLMLVLLAWYRRWLSPLLGGRCRFLPSCSVYAEECVGQFGPLRGGWLAAWRLLRCHPLCRGGFDPPPERFQMLPRPHADRSLGEQTMGES